MYKVKEDKKPQYLYEKIGTQIGRNTRLEADRISSNLLKEDRNFETATAERSFVPRTIEDWNKLPNYLRVMDKLKLFKIKPKI